MFGKSEDKKELVWCPVGRHTELGYRTIGRRAAFVCTECQFIFSMDSKGKWVKAEKIKAAPKTCGCATCRERR